MTETKNGRHSLTLADARAATPAITDAAACVIRLQGAVFDSIGEADVKEIMKKQIAKAKDGDGAAAKLILDYCANPKVNYRRSDVTVTHKDERCGRDPQVIDAPPPGASLLELHARRSIAEILSNGPQSAQDLAGELRMPESVLASLLSAPWFDRGAGNQWRLTTAGRKDLL